MKKITTMLKTHPASIVRLKVGVVSKESLELDKESVECLLVECKPLLDFRLRFHFLARIHRKHGSCDSSS